MKWTLKPNSVIPYFSTGNIQLYHVVEDILQQTGKADLFISSFTIAEEFIRRLYKSKEKDSIGVLQLLIDHRSALKTLHLSNFLFSVADEVYLSNNHSKIILIENNDHKISIVTSQNQTRGNRYEAGMICSISDTFDFFDQQIKNELNKCIKLSEVLRRNIEPG